MNLSPDLERWRHEIEAYARQYGLDFYDVVFEVLDYDQLNEVAAYGGFPTRYPHWRFGMDYEELAKTYTYGLSKIYELVINNNPVYAYLMKANAPVEQKLVMAHVFGHADFFKNNLWFSKTNRRMIDAMANHATRVRHHVDRHGVEAVEDMIDACLSLENLIDYHSHFIERQEKKERRPLAAPREEEPPAVRRLKSKSYMDPYINPPQALEQAFVALAASRPTAVNLFWALERMQRVSPRTAAALAREAEAMQVLANARHTGAPNAIDRATAILEGTRSGTKTDALKARVNELAEALFQSIGMQLSVEKYAAISVGRGANLDELDVPLNNRVWLTNRFAELRDLSSEREKLRGIEKIVHWTDPGPGGFYDDLGDPALPGRTPGGAACEQEELPRLVDGSRRCAGAIDLRPARRLQGDHAARARRGANRTRADQGRGDRGGRPRLHR